jgi:hypothetical protein
LTTTYQIDPEGAPLYRIDATDGINAVTTYFADGSTTITVKDETTGESQMDTISTDQHSSDPLQVHIGDTLTISGYSDQNDLPYHGDYPVNCELTYNNKFQALIGHVSDTGSANFSFTYQVPSLTVGAKYKIVLDESAGGYFIGSTIQINAAVPSHTITFKSSGLSTGDYTGTVLNIAGTDYTYSQLSSGVTQTWYEDSTHTVTATSPAGVSSSKQYVFSNWTSGNGLSTATGTFTTPTSDTTVTVNYNTQYKVTFTASGGNILTDGSGTIVTVAGVPKTRIDLPFTTDWLNSGSIVSWAYAGNVSLSSDPTHKMYLSSTSGLNQTGQLGTLTVTSAGTVTGTYATATHFTVSAPVSVTAGSLFSVTVTAKDGEQTVIGYTGTINFTSTDTALGITLPADYTFVASDNGVHTFTTAATLKTAGPQTVTATDTATSSITGTSSQITVCAAAATTFNITAPTSSTAGSSFSVTVTVQDEFGNVVANYTGSVNFTSTDNAVGMTLPANYTFTAGDNGAHTFTDGFTLLTAGSQTITVTDNVTASITATSSIITVNADSVAAFAVDVPATATAGSNFSVTVTAKDAYGNIVTNYTGSVHFSSNGSAVGTALPADYTFATGDHGVHTFTNAFNLTTAGSKTITVADGALTGTSDAISIGAASAYKLAFINVSSSYKVAESSSAITVQIQDRYGNPTTTPLETDFDLSASGGNWYSDSALNNEITSLTIGAGTSSSANIYFMGTTVGTATIGASANGLTSASSEIEVTVGDFDHFALSGPITVNSGEPFTITITACDAYDNTITDYNGTIEFLSTDTSYGVVLPEQYNFTETDAGVHDFTDGFTLISPLRDQVISVRELGEETQYSTVEMSVFYVEANKLMLSGPASATAGACSDAFRIVVQDAGSHIVAVRSDAIIALEVSSGTWYSDVACTTPITTITIPEGNAASVEFYYKGTTAGTITLGASKEGLTSASGEITVHTASIVKFNISAPASVTAGSVFSVTVTAQDQYGNTVTNYTGSIHFTSTDAAVGITLPSDYTFTVQDNGMHTFTNAFNLTTAGSKTVTATDKAVSSLNGTSNSITVNAAQASTFTINAPASVTAGSAFNITVTAKDEYGNIATGYRGTVNFTSTDNSASVVLPADYQFTETDNGAHTFTGVKLINATLLPHPKITIEDASDITLTVFKSILVMASQMSKLGFLSLQDAVIAGQSTSAFKVQLQDVYGNPVMVMGAKSITLSTTSGNYYSDAQGLHQISSIQIQFMQTDSSAIYYMSTTTGSADLTVTSDSVSSANAHVTVMPAEIDHFDMTVFPTSATAGQPITGSITITAYDAYNNKKTDYDGQVYFNSTDASAILPFTQDAKYTFTIGDNGTHAFSGFTLATTGNQNITVTDGFISATSGNITVSQPIPPTQYYTITVTQTSHGQISPSSRVIKEGFSLSLTITPESSYHIVSITVDGIPAAIASPDGQTISLTNIQEDHTVTATFAINTYTITVISAHGNPTASSIVNAGTSFTASVTSPEVISNLAHWVCNGYSIDGSALTNGTTCILIGINSDHSVTFSWTEVFADMTVIAAGPDNTKTVIQVGGNITGNQFTNMTITPHPTNGTTTVAFVLTGPEGTEGFGNLTLPKSVIPYGTIPTIYVDGQQVQKQGYIEDATNFYVWYFVHFSSHNVTIDFVSTNSNPTPTPTPSPSPTLAPTSTPTATSTPTTSVSPTAQATTTPNINQPTLSPEVTAIIIIIIALLLIVLILALKRRKHKEEQ